jgi:hypothetical protein
MMNYWKPYENIRKNKTVDHHWFLWIVVTSSNITIFLIKKNIGEGQDYSW